MSKSETEAKIELFDVGVARGEVLNPVPIIDNVTWSVRGNEFWVVGGLPGSGKTDLLATAAGLQKPVHGLQFLFGTDTRQMDEGEFVEKRLRVGMVFGNGRLFPQLTVADNLALPICYHSNWHADRALDQVKAALALTGLEAIANRRPGQITRNLHQRIGLARALALEPEVLLIDNPLQGVDPRMGRWWLDFLRGLAEGHPALGRKISIVVAADDLRPWLEFAGQFAVIRERHFEVVGSAADLKRSNDPVIGELLSSPFARG